MDNYVGPLELLRILDDGKVLDDLHEAIDELIMRVRMAHKKGSVDLKLEVKPSKDGESLKVSIKGDVKPKYPYIERGADIFYVGEANRLSRRNPRQPTLSANTVKMPPPEERSDIDRKSAAAGEKA